MQVLYVYLDLQLKYEIYVSVYCISVWREKEVGCCWMWCSNSETERRNWTAEIELDCIITAMERGGVKTVEDKMFTQWRLYSNLIVSSEQRIHVTDIQICQKDTSTDVFRTKKIGLSLFIIFILIILSCGFRRQTKENRKVDRKCKVTHANTPTQAYTDTPKKKRKKKLLSLRLHA